MSASDHERIVAVDDETYENAVSDGLVLLDFWAEWCGPCKALGPVVEELVEEHSSLTVAKLDADENEAGMDEFGVRSLPTMILFKRGEPVEVYTLQRRRACRGLRRQGRLPQTRQGSDETRVTTL